MTDEQQDFEDRVTYEKWLNAMAWLVDTQKEEHGALMGVTELVLAHAIDKCLVHPEADVAMVKLSQFALWLGYYYGRQGISAPMPDTPKEFTQELMSSMMSPDCDCNACKIKLRVVSDAGTEYKQPEIPTEMHEVVQKILGMLQMEPKNSDPSSN